MSIKISHTKSWIYGLTLITALFILAVKIYASFSVTLCWNANTETNLAGYNIYYGNSSRNYSYSSYTLYTNYSFNDLDNNLIHFFAVTATNQQGLESAYSTEIIYPDVSAFNNITNLGIYYPKYVIYGTNYINNDGTSNSNIFRRLTSFTLAWPSNHIPQFSTNLLNWVNLALASSNNFKEIDTSQYPQCFFRTVTHAIPPLIESNYIFGNTNNGTTLDNLYDIIPYINASRYYCSSNKTVSELYAKLPTDSGRYKFAIYSDDNGSASSLLAQTIELVNPTNGWNKSLLATPYDILAGNYYWLAVWSDSPTAKIYYNGSTAPLRWQGLIYGNWPLTLTTSGVGFANYCIYLK
jgi:hypothetical protein